MGDGKPKKEDVDKMHSYRDAIRDENDRHVVRYAATLYPGKTTRFGDGLAAIHAYPGNETALAAEIQSVIDEWLGG